LLDVLINALTLFWVTTNPSSSPSGSPSEDEETVNMQTPMGRITARRITTELDRPKLDVAIEMSSKLFDERHASSNPDSDATHESSPPSASQ
jgi:hypothetical protein